MARFNIFEFMQPKESATKISDPKVIDSKYKYWRIRILYSTYFGYAAYYFTRKNFVFALPTMVKELHIDKAEIGLLGTLFYITYGISKFSSGIMSDKSNPRYFMAFGLILTGFVNIGFGLSNTIPMFILFWIMNGFFQGWGWPPCARSS